MDIIGVPGEKQKTSMLGTWEDSERPANKLAFDILGTLLIETCEKIFRANHRGFYWYKITRRDGQGNFLHGALMTAHLLGEMSRYLSVPDFNRIRRS